MAKLPYWAHKSCHLYYIARATVGSKGKEEAGGAARKAAEEGAKATNVGAIYRRYPCGLSHDRIDRPIFESYVCQCAFCNGSLGAKHVSENSHMKGLKWAIISYIINFRH